MKTKSIINTLLFLLLLNQHLFGFTSSKSKTDIIIEAKQLLKEASITSDTNLVSQARKMFIKVYESDSSHQVLYFIAQSEYELVRIAYAYKDYNNFEKHYNKAVKIINKLIEEKPDWPEPHTLLSLLYGYKIAKNSIHAVTLGPKAFFLAQRALELDDKNPRSWFVMGTIKFHMPRFVGGGIDKAITAFKKSIEIFETTNRVIDPLTPEWGYIDALLWLGHSYEKQKQPQKAYELYRKALTTYPQANWIYSIFIEPLKKKYNLN